MINNLSAREVRLTFCDVFAKIQNRSLLSPLESQVAYVIDAYPEHHALLADRSGLEHVYEMENNPFLELSLHLAVMEQVTHDRPSGIRALYQGAMGQESAMCVEKRMASVLKKIMHQTLSQAQDQAQEGLLDQVYLEALQLEFRGK